MPTSTSPKPKTVTLEDLHRQLLAALPSRKGGAFDIQDCEDARVLAERFSVTRPEISKALNTLRRAKLVDYTAPYSVRPSGWHRSSMGDRALAAAKDRKLAAVIVKPNGGLTLTFTP